jgi:hypothetical protein
MRETRDRPRFEKTGFGEPERNEKKRGAVKKVSTDCGEFCHRAEITIIYTTRTKS